MSQTVNHIIYHQNNWNHGVKSFLNSFFLSIPTNFLQKPFEICKTSNARIPHCLQHFTGVDF